VEGGGRVCQLPDLTPPSLSSSPLDGAVMAAQAADLSTGTGAEEGEEEEEGEEPQHATLASGPASALASALDSGPASALPSALPSAPAKGPASGPSAQAADLSTGTGAEEGKRVLPNIIETCQYRGIGPGVCQLPDLAPPSLSSSPLDRAVMAAQAADLSNGTGAEEGKRVLPVIIETCQ
jgi:hypothetical protein